MAITCPRCGADFDATLFEFGHRVRCGCGAEVEYPGADLRGGHVATGSRRPDEEVFYRQRKIRVPTAAEWEYAARVGTSNSEIEYIQGRTKDRVASGGCPPEAPTDPNVRN